MTLEEMHVITAALKRGAKVQVKKTGTKTTKWQTLTLEDNCPMLDGIALVAYNSSNIAINITEPPSPRLPNKKELLQWFVEQKVFKAKLNQLYVRILYCDFDEYYHQIAVGEDTYTIEDFVNTFVDVNGNSLMVIEKF